MKKVRSILFKIAAAMIILVLIFGGVIGFLFQFYFPITVASLSFPQTSGEITIKGLEHEVEIYRDEMGIPNIYASTLHDLFFAQGYVHAQDRFWQMDFWRHI
ncbi:MAG: penicillin acylase family protein, partial [Anaerolineales bacterium]